MYIDILVRKNQKRLKVPISPKAREIVEKSGKKLFPYCHNSSFRRQDTMTELKRAFGPRGSGVRYCKKHGVVMHSFRHGFAMRKFAEGTPIEVIAQLLGQSVLRVTEMYARYLPDENLLKYI